METSPAAQPLRGLEARMLRRPLIRGMPMKPPDEPLKWGLAYTMTRHSLGAPVPVPTPHEFHRQDGIGGWYPVHERFELGQVQVFWRCEIHYPATLVIC